MSLSLLALKTVLFALLAGAVLVGVGSLGGMVHALERRRRGWFLAIVCFPLAGPLYVVLHRDQAATQWKVVKVGLVTMAIAAFLAVAGAALG